jgi:hypothetical protein
MRRARFIWLVFAVLLLAGVALAQPQAAQMPEMSASVEPSDVEVGEPFNVVLTVSSPSGGPSASDPQLILPSALRASPPSLSSQQQISFINGRLIRKSGISATWQVLAAREGVFVIGPPTVNFNGQRVGANTLRVTVHAAGSGTGRTRRAPRSSNPFDPFGMFPKLPGLFEPPDVSIPDEPAQDPSLSLDAPLDARVFLRSVIDQKTPVVGEQVTLTIYMYARSSVEATEPHEPSVADFFRRDLLAANTQEQPRVVSINGVTWRAQTIYKSALFPLRAGDLEIGPMQATFLTTGSAPLLRQSQLIRLRVSEPPARGRPVGYQIGDVGNYALSVSVEPRTAEVGGAFAVNVTLGGIGNVPASVRVPGSSSVEWLEPQVRENIEVENGKVRGSRRFTYVVRPKTPGTIELGAVTLPYWDPDRKVYDIARGALGKIVVTADSAQAVGKEPTPPHDPWSALAAPRAELGAFRRANEPFTDKPFYWLGLFGAPLAVVATSLGARSATRARRWLGERRRSKERGIDEALAEARAATQKGNGAVAASQLERALYLAIERATELKARALLVGELPAELERRGVQVELATRVGALLSSLETLRFSPDGAVDHGDIAERAAAAVRQLGRIPSPSRAQAEHGVAG